MKIVKDYPPNFSLIKEFFDIGGLTPTFCFRDTIYNPFDIEITPDIIIHERTHRDQQGDNPDDWWLKYIMDKDFRLSQEIEAYGEQFLFLKYIITKNPKLLEWFKEKLASALSSKLYGNMLTYGQALAKIRFYGRRNHKTSWE